MLDIGMKTPPIDTNTYSSITGPLVTELFRPSYLIYGVTRRSPLVLEKGRAIPVILHSITHKARAVDPYSFDQGRGHPVVFRGLLTDDGPL
jgi:hypothetical protein